MRKGFFLTECSPPFLIIFLMTAGIYAAFAQEVFVPTEPTWRGALGGVILCPPSCRDGAVVVVCDGGFVRSFSYAGRELWTFRSRGRFAPFITRGPDGITWVALMDEDAPRTLIALNRVGREIARLSFDAPIASLPEAGLDGRIFVTLDSQKSADTPQKETAAYNLRGRKLGIQDEFRPVPAQDPTVRLSLTRAEGLSPNGSVKWALDIRNAAALPAYNGEGLLVIGYKDWLLAAYKVDDAAPAIAAETYGLARRVPYANIFTLKSVRAQIENGAVNGEEKAIASFLMDKSRIQPNRHLDASSAEERIEALNLLGGLGSPEYAPFLIDVFLREKNGLVRAAAARALGEIGVDRGGKIMAAFENEALPVSFLQDETVLNAVLQAAGRISLINGPPAAGSAVRLLGAYHAQKNYPRLAEIAGLWLDRIMAR